MKSSDILSKVMAKKGQFGRVVIRKPLKTYKGVTALIEKETSMTMRAGINYDNLKVVKEKRESGELPEVNQGLPFGKWVAFPYLIENKGEHYVRLYPGNNVKTSYFLNGKPVDFNEIVSMVRASEMPKPQSDCITVKLQNIQELE